MTYANRKRLRRENTQRRHHELNRQARIIIRQGVTAVIENLQDNINPDDIMTSAVGYLLADNVSRRGLARLLIVAHHQRHPECADYGKTIRDIDHLAMSAPSCLQLAHAVAVELMHLGAAQVGIQLIGEDIPHDLPMGNYL